jgi:membrane-associated phospholipid phosphatase
VTALTSEARSRQARARVALGLTGLAVTALSLRRGRVGAREADVFRALNRLPGALYPPTWVVMQLGSLGAAPASAAVAHLAGRPKLAVRLAQAGTITWAMAKGVKRVARRGRPATLLAGVRHRGKQASGLGYLSGHAGVAAALAGTALPELAGPAGPVVVALASVVGLARIYVGAHLPLDVAGGAALGLAVDGALALRDRGRP